MFSVWASGKIKKGKKHNEKKTQGALTSAWMLCGRQGFQNMVLRGGVGSFLCSSQHCRKALATPSASSPTTFLISLHFLTFLHSLHVYLSYQCLCYSNETVIFWLQNPSIHSFPCPECSPSRSLHGCLLPIVQASTPTSSLQRAYCGSVTKVDPAPTNLCHNILFYSTYGTYLVYLLNLSSFHYIP